MVEFLGHPAPDVVLLIQPGAQQAPDLALSPQPFPDLASPEQTTPGAAAPDQVMAVGHCCLPDLAALTDRAPHARPRSGPRPRRPLSRARLRLAELCLLWLCTTPVHETNVFEAGDFDGCN